MNYTSLQVKTSYSILSSLNDIKKLAKNGYKEIMLLGQNVNSYGNDFKDENKGYEYLQKAADFAQIKRKSPFAGTLSFSGIYMYTGSAGIKSFFAVQFIPGLLQMPLTCFS